MASQPPQPPRPIGFPEFGVRFVHAALTAERIQAKFREKVGPMPEEPVETGVPLVDGTVAAVLSDVWIEELTPNDLDLNAAYVAHLELKLHLKLTTIAGLNGNYDASFKIPCKLKVIAMTPLSLRIAADAILGTDIAMNLKGTDLIAQIADFKVRDIMAGKVAEKVNLKLFEAQADMNVDLLKILAESDKPADPGAAPPDGTVVKTFSTDIASPVPLGPGDSFRGEIQGGSHAYFKVVVDPNVVFRIDAGVRVHDNGPWTDLSWQLVDFDENLLAKSSEETAVEKENFQKFDWRLHSDERHEAALLILKTAAADATVRGKLTFEPYTG